MEAFPHGAPAAISSPSFLLCDLLSCIEWIQMMREKSYPWSTLVSCCGSFSRPGAHRRSNDLFAVDQSWEHSVQLFEATCI